MTAMVKTKTKERPIDLNADEVRGILEGKLTHLRRPVRPQPERSGDGWLYRGEFFGSDDAMKSHLFHDVYGTGKGMRYGGVYGDGSADRLWVREAWGESKGRTPRFPKGKALYQTDHGVICGGSEFDLMSWRPPVSMPRSASRITLQLTDVDVELREADDCWLWLLSFKRISPA